ncbi:unnamed protein product [Didymodactylos carnosus]|uniref:Secreted protein n=1 Tax=Didymodactylos carnosus TaxID=1234261 RepID=A0A815EYF7_9BILA|nr:unnamed protein product [Didymodactylos carnosus]CAF1317857.1 unnamed protein product [Didymodactylos carnosus]CAF3899202.1 unnamed protein product [Didymodactylos carnosus]CAF4161274.1 unnamed protein product [Didymodactylos carnosus]
MIISIIALLATALLITFDAVFLSKPDTCILTPSCTNTAAQTSGVYYTLKRDNANESYPPASQQQYPPMQPQPRPRELPWDPPKQY